MPKINFLKIKNYKSILDFECKLGPGVNVFVGHSDSGKSNVVRALRDFFFNASGDSVVTAKQTRCSIAVNDCIWEKGKGLNRYVLPMGTFENVGRTSPQELRDLFKIDEIQWDDTHSKRLQFIQQHEPKFFLDESFTGSLNAKILGLVSGIQRTYNGNRLVINDIRDAKGRRETALSIKAAAEKDLVKYQGLAKQKHILDVIEKSITALTALENTRDKLTTAAQELKILNTKISDTAQRIPKDALDSTEAIQRIHKDALNISMIRKLATEAELLHQKISKSKKIDSIDIDSADFDLLNTITTETAAIRRAAAVISTLRSEYRSEATQLTSMERDMENMVSELKKIVDETDMCPLTNDAFCDGCKDKIIGCIK